MTSTGFRLSPQQRHLRALDRAGGGGALRVSACVTLRGALDGDRLRAALRRVVEEHEVLRTTFSVGAEGGRQVVHDAADVALAREDLSGVGDDERRARLDALRTGASAGDDATTLLRATWASLGGDRHALVLALPAACVDGAGVRRLVDELLDAYATPEDVPGGDEEDEGPLQVADLAEWQLEQLEAEEAAPAREHWRALDLAALNAAVVPFQQPPGAFAPARVTRRADAALAGAVDALAAALSVSPRAVMLAGLATLLRRLSAQSPVVVGHVADGRRLEELADVVGPLERTLPVRLEVAAGTTFADVVRAAHERSEAAERRIEGLDLSALRDAPAPLVGTERFVPWQLRVTGPATAPVAPDGLAVEACDVRATTDRFVGRVDATLDAAGLVTHLDHDTSALDEATAARFLGQLHALLADGCARPDADVALLDALAPEERQALVVDFNATDAPYREELLAHRWFEEQVAATPDAIAIRQNEDTLTYRELDEAANRLAHHLVERGVGPDVLVALCIERTPDMAVGILGILKAGGAYVPIDPAYPEERLRFLLEDTRAPVLVTQQSMLAQLPTGGTQVVCLDRSEDRAAIDAHPSTPPETAVAPHHLVYVIYTSGSTGKPKGVVITHEKLVISNTAREHAFGHVPRNFLLLSSVAFDSSVVGIFWTLCGGGTLFLIPEGQQKDIAQIPRTIALYEISHLLTLPSFYRLILDQAAEQAEARGKHPMAGMHTAIVAGEACPLNMVEAHKRALPGVGLYSEYGATETTVFSSVYDCLQQTRSIAPVGDPIENARMYVLDEHLNPCPTGVPGEVHFGGTALALGYWRRPELTAERFVPDPFATRPGERLYKSGDLARHLDQGDVEFLGRLDNQVKIRGYRIELEEIESVLLGHPGVKEAAVLALTDLSSEKRLVGYVVSEGAAPSVNELREHVQQTLPEFMTPAVFVFMDDFPRTPNGKTDRKALPEPGAERPELESAFAAPSSPAEQVLADIWADVLGLEQVGVEDNFFELGGDSILSIQVVSRAKAAGVKLSARQVFEHQTIRALVGVAEVTEVAPAVTAEQGDVVGAVPLTPVQRWFLDLGLPHPSHWNMPMLLDVAPRVDAVHLEQAVAALVAHHDALRLRVRKGEAGWEQEFAAPDDDAGPFVHVEDLSDVAEGEQGAALDRRAAAHHAAIDLARGPVVRVVLFERGEGRPQRLLWIVHHLAVDGVSWRVLLEDLGTALGQLERGEAIALPPKTTSFRTWAEGLQGWARSATLASELPHWTALADETTAPAGAAGDAAAAGGPARADGHTSLASVPLDHPDGVNRESTVEKVRVALDEEQTRALLSEAPAAYNTQINDLLLTAFVHAVAQWTGRDAVLLNLEGHGREEVVPGADLSRTVGWFTTDYPVLLHDTVPFEPGAAVKSVKEQLRAVPGQGFGFGVAKHLAAPAGVPGAERVAAVPQPALGFNYLGQFDQMFREGDRFRYVEAPSGPAMHPDGRRVFVLEVYGMVTGGRLELDFESSRALHDRATVQRLADEFLSTLRAVVEHCRSPGAGGFTTSDFADFSWGEGDLSSIASAIARSQGGGAPGGDVGADREPDGGDGGGP